MRGAAGYHTSVLLGGEEFYFSPFGICCSHKITSHDSTDVKRTFMGTSDLSSKDILAALSDEFRPGSYDILRKNCNAFTDCCLYLLCRKRLDANFRAAEMLGQVADSAGLVQTLTFGAYTRNEKAAGFDLEAVIAKIDASGCRSPVAAPRTPRVASSKRSLLPEPVQTEEGLCSPPRAYSPTRMRDAFAEVPEQLSASREEETDDGGDDHPADSCLCRCEGSLHERSEANRPL
eukprot:TRINITY_DN1412_c0_g1_i1.p1 TRINITY_DN1412_c0_g1~~TRINITY_DN1412_c0_g1_i1.p1  ORF type:complete len:233 (-),score=41.08 TRINITY_DN1412_c0_g1_i1:156-854(-)